MIRLTLTPYARSSFSDEATPRAVIIISLPPVILYCHIYDSKYRTPQRTAAFMSPTYHVSHMPCVAISKHGSI